MDYSVSSCYCPQSHPESWVSAFQFLQLQHLSDPENPPNPNSLPENRNKSVASLGRDFWAFVLGCAVLFLEPRGHPLPSPSCVADAPVFLGMT